MPETRRKKLLILVKLPLRAADTPADTPGSDTTYRRTSETQSF